MNRKTARILLQILGIQYLFWLSTDAVPFVITVAGNALLLATAIELMMVLARGAPAARTEGNVSEEP